jgi:hypothetical protein
MSSEDTTPPAHDTAGARARVARSDFSERLRRRILQEFGIPAEHASTWLSRKVGVRWQTAQFWLDGTSMPAGHNMARVAEAVRMDARELFLTEPEDEPETPAWRAFLQTPEGASMTPAERQACHLFLWQKAPTVGDYRSLLAVVRQNAER